MESKEETVDNILGLFEKLESQSLAVQPSRCVVVRNRNATCRRCAEACPTGAILVEGNDLAVAPERCIGCGTCATVCPTAALESKKPDDKELLRAAVAAMQANDGAAVIMDAAMQAAAEGKYDPAKVAVVKSLGRVDESFIAVLVAGGATSVALVAGPAEGKTAEGNAEATEAAETAGTVGAAPDRAAQLVRDTAALLLETWGSDVSVKLTTKLPRSVRLAEPAEFDTGRRGFFSSMRDEARAAAAITAEHVVREKLGADEPEEPKFAKVTEDGTLPHFLPERRGRLLLALSNLGEPEDIMIDTRLFGHVIIDPEKCTSCQMCATFCPTEAIRKFGDADPFDRRVRHGRDQARPLRAHRDASPQAQGERPEVHRERHERPARRPQRLRAVGGAPCENSEYDSKFSQATKGTPSTSSDLLQVHRRGLPSARLAGGKKGGPLVRDEALFCHGARMRRAQLK